MSLSFPYRLKRLAQPVLALGGRFSRPQPAVWVELFGPTGRFTDWAVLDTGSDETLFPIPVAARVGIDLTDAPTAQAEGAGPGAITLSLAQITLRLTDGRETREWPAWVGFAANLRRPLLGFAGCLRFFTATFHGDREQVELAANPLYPGT